MNACPTVKIFANFAIGFNNFDIGEAKKRGIFMTNTPGGGAWRVSEHTWALILALTCRVVEGDELMRSGKYKGWDPNLLPGTELVGKTLGIIGTGKIGADVARKGKKGFGMNIVYYDIVKNTPLEEELGAVYYSNADEVLKVSDIVSLHVPLNEKTRQAWRLKESLVYLDIPERVLLTVRQRNQAGFMAFLKATKFDSRFLDVLYSKQPKPVAVKEIVGLAKKVGRLDLANDLAAIYQRYTVYRV